MIAPPETPVLPAFVDLFAIGLFALSGALSGTRSRQTFVTVAFFALIAGVGGGTVRDVLIGAPVFWVHDRFVAPVCLAVATLAWLTPSHWYNARLLVWADALGLAVYSVLGTIKALGWGVPPVPSFLMGVMTGCAGGIIRDVIAGQPSILMRPELYVTASALASAAGALMIALGVSPITAWICAALAGFALRGAAIQWSIGLPTYSAEDDPDEAGPP
ncbi:trimeric intracellular cation channel family protein [Novosphingobium profundi]|uniref:trimeric intracellular cation channel family protein n=1 Tax=Novosphingobium profundi TaxID=1774954 RepID=UPI001BDAF456|nr:trimeric intracellular cation channel family protein [Novosphingobium profundi]MBT0666898.1 trimeric intracellular cation channel family protein [Novosphingobium profundi]